MTAFKRFQWCILDFLDGLVSEPSLPAADHNHNRVHINDDQHPFRAQCEHEHTTIDWRVSSQIELSQQQVAYSLLRPSVALARRAVLEYTNVDDITTAIQNLVLSASDAELNVNAQRYADLGLTWRSVHNVACVLVAATIIKYICMIYDTRVAYEGRDLQYGVNDAIYFLDFALIKTAGFPCLVTIHRLHGLIASFLEDANNDNGHQTATLESIEVKVPKLIYPGKQLIRPSLAAFWNNLSVPCLMKDTLDHWLAFDPQHSWSSINYLLKMTSQGRRIVPVEIGSSYVDPDMSQRIMMFKDYLFKYVLNQDSNRSKHAIGYLAQHDLLTQVPALRHDICVPDYIYAQGCEPVINTWIGPAGTVTPLHFDRYWNMLCQVVGKKYVRLYAPDQSKYLYPRGIDELGINMFNTSFVDVEGQNEEYPLFNKAVYVEYILEPGDCLFIPPQWWHYVRSISISVSVNFWWLQDENSEESS